VAHPHPRALRLGLLCTVLLCACSRGPAPNLLLVTFDTTRYDHLGCTGDPEARTPVVDALAERGLLFDRTFASAPLTLPSHTTMLTGLEPLTHGVHHNGRFRASDELETLAEMLRDHGYATGAFVSAFVLDPRYNLSQGFDVYSAETRRKSDPLDLTVPQRPGADVTDEALRWLDESSGDAPFFVWAHYYDPHLPRSVEPPFDALGDAYRAEIAYADAQLGRLLEGVARTSNGRETLIVFTSDHGESLGEHGEQTHGLLAYDSSLRVPLILAGPGVPRDTRTRVFARHIDLLPTILGALRVPVPPDLPGRDLLRAVSDAAADSLVGYFESQGAHFDLGWAPITGVRTERWKYTVTPAPAELYDVQADPREKTNLAELRPEVVTELGALYARLHETQMRPGLESQRRDMDAEEMAQLAALGYVEIPIAAGDEAPDPRTFIGVHGWVGYGRALARSGQYLRSIELLETLSESPSVRALVIRTLAPIYAQAGRFDDAIRTYRLYIELTGAPEARLGLSRTLLQANRPGEALAVIDEIAPHSPKLAFRRAQALGQLGRHEEARLVVDEAFAGRHLARDRRRSRAFLVLDAAPIADGEEELRALLAAAPDDAILKSRLGFYLAIWAPEDRGEEAGRLLREAAASLEDSPEFQSNLGWGLFHLGADDEARVALEAALAIDATRQLDRVRLARVLRRTGESERALALVRSALAIHPAAVWSDDARALEAEIEAEPSTPPSVGARS
jgi:arylsulfatase A-like enzyme/Flp pilus assembly protein TadD